MATEILMPALSPTMESGTLAKWLVSEGDHVKSGDLLAEIETDKATMEFESVDEGYIGKIFIAEGTENIPVNSTIAVLMDERETFSKSEFSDVRAVKEVAQTEVKGSVSRQRIDISSEAENYSNNVRVFISPLARRIALAEGVNFSKIKGTGPKGRIIKADILPLLEAANEGHLSGNARQTTSSLSLTSTSSGETVKQLYKDRTFSEVSIDGMRKTLATRLSKAKQTIPHFYLRRDIDIDAMLVLREQANKELKDVGIKLSVNDFIIKACAMALQTVQSTNVVWAGDRLLQFKSSDIAVAVAVDGGLFTPVLRDADQKSLSLLSNEMKELSLKAREKKLLPQDYQGGSFTISNLGMFGIENFDAVINPPQSAILAVGRGKKKPIIQNDGTIGSATVMSVTLSVDHRAIDGALGARLLAEIVKKLENPIALLI